MSVLLPIVPLLLLQVPTVDGAKVAAAARVALEEAPVVTYRADLRRQLQVEQTGWVADGQVWFRRATEERPAALRIDGTVRRLADRGGKEEVQASLWLAGERWVYLDRTAKVVTEGKGPGLGGEPSAALARLLPPGWLGGESIDPQLDWGQAAQSSFAGELCDVIETRGENREERWLLGPDHLPRQHVVRTRRGAEMIFVTVRFQRFRASGDPGAQVFEVPLPEGLEQRAPLGVVAFPVRRASSAKVVSLAHNLDAFVEGFDRGQDRVRLVGLFGPT